MNAPAAPHREETADSRLFRQQESALVAFNLFVLTGLVLVHLGFSEILGAPNRRVLLAIFVFFVVQLVELLLLRRRRGSYSRRWITLYPRFSVGAKLLIGTAIALAGHIEDHHYAALLILPIISAAFRFPVPGVLGVAAAAGILTMAQVRLFYLIHPPIVGREFYEAGSVVLIYFLVGLVVWYLNGQLRQDRQRLQASLDELERTKDRLVTEEKLAAVGRLAGAIAHEIRNPVAMITSSAELVKAGRTDEAQQKEMCDIVLGESRRLERLTTDFLLYARNRPVERREATVCDLLRYLGGLAHARVRESGREIRIDCPEDGIIQVDTFQIHQAMLNLLVNALQDSPEGSAVIVGGRRRGERDIVLFVENRGGPIPPETAARLFEPFFTTKEQGTGLGLAIARNIARNHGGELVLGLNAGGAVRFDLLLPGAWDAAIGAGGPDRLPESTTAPPDNAASSGGSAGSGAARKR